MATDWNKQMEEMVRKWTEMQQQMWDSWLQSARSVGVPGATGSEEWQKEYQKQLEAWEKSVREALEAQVQWTREFTEKAGSSEYAPQAVNEMLHQSQEMMKSWTEAQAKLWDAWFDSVKNIDPSNMGSWDADGQKVLKAWQEATQRAQDALQELSRAAASGGAGGASGGASSGGSGGSGSRGGRSSGGSKKS